MKQKNVLNGESANAQIPDICGKYVNLMNDVAFQWVFGQESNKDLLIALLNELLPHLHIEGLEFYKQRQLSFSKNLKSSVFDVSCRLTDGTYIDVEVQVKEQDWFSDRCLYYSTYCIQNQIAVGQEEYTLKPVYVISIDAFSRPHAANWDGSVLSSYSLREDRTYELMTDNLHFVFVELENFNKKWEDIDNDKERFYFCIRHMHELKDLPDGFAQGIWAKLAQQSELAEMPSEVKTKYIKDMVTEMDKRAQMKCALRKATEQGLAEGRAQGLEQGLEQGKLETARKMKADGLDAELICKYTGLAPEQITEL